MNRNWDKTNLVSTNINPDLSERTGRPYPFPFLCLPLQLPDSRLKGLSLSPGTEVFSSSVLSTKVCAFQNQQKNLWILKNSARSKANVSEIQTIFWERERNNFFPGDIEIFVKGIEIQIEVWKFWTLSCLSWDNKYCEDLGYCLWKGYTMFKCLSFGIKLLLPSYNIKLVSNLLFFPRGELSVQWVWPWKVIGSVYSPDFLGVIFNKYHWSMSCV